MKNYVLLFFLVFLSCESIIFEKDLADTYVNNFDVFWNDLDKHYSFFDQKQIHWDSVYSEYQSRVKGINSDTEFYEILEEIILSLKDGHTNLFAMGNIVSYNFTDGFPENSPQFVADYLENINIPNNNLLYGDIQNSDLGYLQVKSFNGGQANFVKIVGLANWLENKSALVLDVRDNRGGSDANASLISSNFASSSQVYRKVKYRLGTEHSDFTDWIQSFIDPAEKTFTKPIALLTNRQCYSATEGFIASLKIFDHITTVGGITGGGSGNPIYRDLPNGWNFRLSNWIVDYTAFGVVEEVGMMPDIMVDISADDISLRKDAILEKAIEILN